MGADFAAFFQHADADVAFFFFGKLLDADGCRQPGRAGADDHDVVLHAVAFGFGVHGCCPYGLCLCLAPPLFQAA